MDCSISPVTPPRIVAIATDKYLTPTNAFGDPSLPAPPPKYGQDITFAVGRPAPGGYDVGKTVSDLKPKMEKLLGIFASSDTSGMARRLFTLFLAKQPAVAYFDNAALNSAAAAHTNIKFFCDAAVGAPELRAPPPGTIRIHQALKAAGWDINKLKAPADLGVPAFNEGNKAFSTGDFANGLGLMINGVQYAYVIATHYHYDSAAGKYCIGLRYVFYDVFGLDDDDLTEYGAKSDGFMYSAAAIGITAWWQLQHQHGFAPLITRITVNKSYELLAR